MGDDMTDLEITKKCAEKMGYIFSVNAVFWQIAATNGKPINRNESVAVYGYIDYDPLHDKAQAMDLVIKFKLQINWNEDGESCQVHLPWEYDIHSDWQKDPLRAICICVAKI